MQKFLNFSSNIYYEKNSLKNVENNSFRNSFAKRDARVKLTYFKLIQIYSRLFQTINLRRSSKNSRHKFNSELIQCSFWFFQITQLV